MQNVLENPCFMYFTFQATSIMQLAGLYLWHNVPTN